ncbi:MAG: sensor histidine kinase [Thermoleophilia bacterium]
MTTAELRRLRLRLTARYAAVSFVVLALLAVAAALVDRDRAQERVDHRVESTVLAADGYAYPQGERLEIDTNPDGYFGADRRPGAPVVVVAPDGRTLAGPAEALDPTAARRALERARTENRVQVYGDRSDGEDVRLASSPVYSGEGDLLATIVAVEPAHTGLGGATLPIIGGAVGLWLLTVLAAWLLTGRAIAPMAAMARREEAFLADAAHELRTPVAVIRARAEQALREAGEAGESAGALRAIGAAAERASATIADMLELARLDARRGRMEREPLRLDLLVEQVADENRERAEAAGAELRVRVDDEAVVEGDERLLGRAVANLVENAVRYGAVGGEIEVALERDGDAARVVVSDRGPGVAPAQRDAIFDRFHRASSAAGGSGLGLPIARLVAEAHDGALELMAPDEARPGARFVLRLPLIEPPA